ncbi:MAG TPA: hypothetical protein DD473_01795, partial [Planctomycetaceae bacterium]|nr:hypothetical protein [Planctomycetaceae bacterium]
MAKADRLASRKEQANRMVRERHREQEPHKVKIDKGHMAVGYRQADNNLRPQPLVARLIKRFVKKRT